MGRIRCKHIKQVRGQGTLFALFLIALVLVACSDAQNGGNTSPDGVAQSGDDTREARAESQGKLLEQPQPTPAAQDQDDPSTGETLAPTKTPEPGKSLTVCLEGELGDLYLYGQSSAAAEGVRHALYELPYNSVGYAYQAHGLEKMPALIDGDARRNVVKVEAGDRVVDAAGDIVTVRKGVRLIDATGAEVEFQDEPLWMEQLVVDFSFKPLLWSDGTPVSAADSVFSFHVAADPMSAVGKEKTAFTASYAATGERSTRWTGLPGYLDPSYMTNVWAPLPSHQLQAFTALQLLSAEETTRLPLSNGPYLISEWKDERMLQLAANHAYYRYGEGLPRIANLMVVAGTLDEFLSGDLGCDVIAGDALGPHNLPALAAEGALGEWEIITAPGNVYQQIAFGVNPESTYAERQPDWFEDARVRQAIALCTDRRRMVDELTGGAGEILNSLAPAAHPLLPAELAPYTYDPVAGNALLDEAGYVDFAGDGRRQDVSSGVPMTITLGTNVESTLRLGVTAIVQENLAECGIPVTRYDRPAGTWFGSGPGGPLFGRQFDLGALAWVGHINPACDTFTAANIPGPETAGYGGWNAPNITGWSNEAYETACLAAQRALPGSESYAQSMAEAMRIFNEQLPALPLFTSYRAVAVRPGVLNVSPDATQPSVLWNVAEWDIEE